MRFETLDADNFLLYAANNYDNPQCIGYDEFQEDLARFKYVKKLLNKYVETGIINERLLLNHLITMFNVFGIEPSLRMLEYRIEEKQHWEILKPCLIFLGYIKETDYAQYNLDVHIVQLLRKIPNGR